VKFPLLSLFEKIGQVGEYLEKFQQNMNSLVIILKIFLLRRAFSSIFFLWGRTFSGSPPGRTDRRPGLGEISP
jgi:hypothetical protein